jgi:hypothetical protein
MKDKDSDLVQRVYREFGPDPIKPERQGELYVDLQDVRGRMDAVSRLNERIRLAEGKPTCQVLAGHKGSGKSTELFRLKKELESGPKPFFVAYVKADDDIDRNDVDFLDVLVALVRQLASQIKKREGVRLKPGYFKDRLQRLGELLTSEIEFRKFELGSALAKFAGEIKGSPDARKKIREILEPDTNNLLNAANDVISEAVLELTKRDKAGLAIIFDDLDKMTVRPHDTGCTTDEYLFVNRAAQLTGFHCHVIYTMPLSLAYSHQEQAIKNSYGGDVPVVPMTKIAARPPKTTPCKEGVEKFRQVLARRLAAANSPERDVFASDEVRDRLIALSGGQPDQLMMLVREAIVSHQLPVTKDSLDRAQRDGKREFARLLRREHWPIIQEVRRSGNYDRSRATDDDAIFRELLQSRAILQYVNADEWYGLNPMVAALKPPAKVK